MKTNSIPISDKSAAAPAYGFFRQLDRVFLWLLLKAEAGSTVTFECWDDVGMRSPDGKLLAEQDKAFTAEESNPLRNRSEAFWGFRVSRGIFHWPTRTHTRRRPVKRVD